jgi:hypothetical protein
MRDRTLSEPRTHPGGMRDRGLSEPKTHPGGTGDRRYTRAEGRIPSHESHVQAWLAARFQMLRLTVLDSESRRGKRRIFSS